MEVYDEATYSDLLACEADLADYEAGGQADADRAAAEADIARELDARAAFLAWEAAHQEPFETMAKWARGGLAGGGDEAPDQHVVAGAARQHEDVPEVVRAEVGPSRSGAGPTSEGVLLPLSQQPARTCRAGCRMALLTVGLYQLRPPPP